MNATAWTENEAVSLVAEDGAIEIDVQHGRPVADADGPIMRMRQMRLVLRGEKAIPHPFAHWRCSLLCWLGEN